MSMGIWETTYKKGLAEGREEGRAEGRVEGLRDALQAQLQEKFGPLSEATLARLQLLTAEQLKARFIALVKAASLKDLDLTD